MAKNPPSTPPPNHLPIPKPHPQTPDPKLGPCKIFEQVLDEVIPEYDLVHYFDKITKLFIGTQALTNDDHIICDPGTSNIVSECHIHDIPIYLFLKTLKFSHYPAMDQNIRKNSYRDEHDGIAYDFSIHSNDIIKLNIISNIITEKGDIALDQIPSIREQILTEH